MPRPETDKECLHNITSMMKYSDDFINTLKKKLVLEMLQQNHELTDFISTASLSLAKTFCEKFHIEPTDDNLQKLIGDVIFMSGIAPLIKELIKADEEARND